MKIRMPPDYLPSLDVEKLPHEEKENARIMMRQIDYMEDFASDVEAAVEPAHAHDNECSCGKAVDSRVRSWEA